MRKLKIAADSSANILTLENTDFASAPMKVITDEREFTDDETLNVGELVAYLDSYKGTSKSSCPNVTDWLSAFGDADDVICITITSGLSGSCNAARSAKRIYEEEREGRRVFVLDSLSAGPEMGLMIQKIRDLAMAGYAFEEICEEITAYREKTGLLFMLKSLKNFANNGRVSPFLAKVVGVMGICIVGRASEEGILEQIDKCRGERRGLERITEQLKADGLSKGRVWIAHSQNEAGAQMLRTMLLREFPEISAEVSECRGLCSFYAEKGGILIGYEKM